MAPRGFRWKRLPRSAPRTKRRLVRDASVRHAAQKCRLALGFAASVRVLGAALVSGLVSASMPRELSSQVLVFSHKYFINEDIRVDSGRGPWVRFKAVGSSRGSPQQCLSWSPSLSGLPDRTLYAPSWGQRQSEIHLWFASGDSLSRAQIIRHEADLPLRDPSDSTKFVIDPITPLIGHTVFLIDLSDSTITAYNRGTDGPQRGVAARLAEVADLATVRETLNQLAEARKLCQRSKRRS